MFYQKLKLDYKIKETKMKKYLLSLSIFLLILSLVGCEESVIDAEPDPDSETKIIVDYSADIKSFFPSDLGDKFNYNVDTLNTSTENFENIGSRLVSVDNMGTGEDENFFLCSEEYNFAGVLTNSQSKFSITETSLDYFADSSGVAELIPDSIEIDIKVIFDKVFKIVNFPFLDKKQFKVFDAGANFGTFKFNIFSIVGEYVGAESLQLEGFDSPHSTEKFKYTVSVNIPDMSNPFVSNIQLYNAFIWFAPTTGIVKMEGCTMFINPISGKKFDIADSNKVVRHTLISTQ